MQPPELPDNEAQRLEAVHQLRVLDTPSNDTFDRLTQLARELFDVPIALVSLVDNNRQWFKSHLGLDATETPRSMSFCAHAISTDQILVIPDTHDDSRFADNPLVVGYPHIRFYAGYPLRPLGNHVVGTFCIIDSQPRTFSAYEQRLLENLAGQAEELLRQHKMSVDLARTASRFEALFSSSAVAKVRINRAGNIIAINASALDMLGYQKDDVIGRNVAMLTPPEIASQHDSFIQHYLDGGEPKVIGKGREVFASHRDGRRVPVHLSINAIHDEHGEVDEFLGVLTDLREIYATQQRMQKEQSLLRILHQGITDYQALMSGEKLWTFLMEALRELTDSEYVLIGEVLPTDTTNALKIHAITDLSWSEKSRDLMIKLRSGDMILKNPDSLLGRVYAYGEVIMTNDVYHNIHHSGFPEGHPVLNNYLGVPITSGGELIGMFAISNSQQSLDKELIQWLQPFTDTCALLINLYRQMADRETVMKELTQAKHQAEKANCAKSEFLSSMSHELRTPLNAILGFAQLLSHGRHHPLNDKQRRQVKQIEKSGQHLLNLINEVLDLAKIESGHLPLSIETIRVDSVINDACDTLEANAEAAGIILTRQPVSERWCVKADYTRTKQVLLNLIYNAIKYNNVNGAITVSTEQQGATLRISVTDTGPGIAPERQHELFEPFNRLDAENGAIEGTGIGLAITRELIERMGGKIGVDSALGKGTTFWFTLPLTENHPPTAITESSRDISPHAVSKQLALLYIEDNPANQRLMEDIVEDLSSVYLQSAPSAEIGLEMMRSSLPDLVLMDIHLSGMDGYQALKAIRRDPAFNHLPVIALSANALPSEAKRSLNAGFDGYLTKPLEIDRLLDMFERYTELLQGKAP
ncbi:GAF domain-containing protein [Halomonas sp. LS-001]